MNQLLRHCWVITDWNIYSELSYILIANNWLHSIAKKWWRSTKWWSSGHISVTGRRGTCNSRKESTKYWQPVYRTVHGLMATTLVNYKFIVHFSMQSIPQIKNVYKQTTSFFIQLSIKISFSTKKYLLDFRSDKREVHF